MLGEIILGTALASGTYLLYKYENNTIEKAEYIVENLKIPKEFNDFNIVQISDLHNKSFGKNNKNLIKVIDELSPNIVVITGDLIEGSSNNFDISLNFVNDISKKYDVYYIIGNHEQKASIKKYKDIYEEYLKKVSNTKAKILDNKYVRLKIKDSYINLYGFTVPFECYTYMLSKHEKRYIDKYYMDETLGNINNLEYNILLAHNPFFFEEYSKWGADLVMAGHVHGGIVRIPKLGGLLSPNREFFPEYDLGKYTINNSDMILSKGLGGSKILSRINCRPEIIKITLKCKI